MTKHYDKAFYDELRQYVYKRWNIDGIPREELVKEASEKFEIHPDFVHDMITCFCIH